MQGQPALRAASSARRNPRAALAAMDAAMIIDPRANRGEAAACMFCLGKL
jgi:hypothetical protein